MWYFLRYSIYPGLLEPNEFFRGIKHTILLEIKKRPGTQFYSWVYSIGTDGRIQIASGRTIEIILVEGERCAERIFGGVRRSCPCQIDGAIKSLRCHYGNFWRNRRDEMLDNRC